MRTDNVLAKSRVTPRLDGDIWLRKGEAHEFLSVDVHSPLMKQVIELRSEHRDIINFQRVDIFSPCPYGYSQLQ